jgi:cytochrome oxidase assembly protein ShyY1
MQPFWRRPRWIAGHVLAVVAVVAFVLLGLWQLDRLEERRAYNALVERRTAAEAVPLAEVLSTPAEAAHRRVEVTGAYEPAGEVLLSVRSLDGRAGHHVLTPLRTLDGTLVVVDRGWVPLEWDDPPVERARPPDGIVDVTGLAQPGTPARRSGRFDGGEGPLQFVTEVDLELVSRSIGEAVAPLYVQAQAPGRPRGEYPAVVPPPELGEGNHLSYAVQWFLFATVVGVGYPLLLRRAARDERGPRHGSARPPATVAG